MKNTIDNEQEISGTKKILIVGGTAIAVAAVTAIGVVIYKNPSKFTHRWFESLSLEELYAERKAVQNNFNNPTLDINYRVQQGELLHVFDKYISILKWAGEKPHAPSYPREHGYNLYKPD